MALIATIKPLLAQIRSHFTRLVVHGYSGDDRIGLHVPGRTVFVVSVHVLASVYFCFYFILCVFGVKSRNYCNCTLYLLLRMHPVNSTPAVIRDMCEQHHAVLVLCR